MSHGKWISLMSLLLSLILAAVNPVAILADGMVPAAGATGFRWYSSDIDGSYQPYAIYVPTTYERQKPMGIVFYLHAFGGSATLKFSDVRKEWANTNNCLLVNLQGRGNQNWDLLADDDLFHVLADLKATFAIDENRLSMEGISMGGHGAYRWAMRYPDMWAASAPSAGWTSYEDFYFKWYCGLSEDAGKWGYNNGNIKPDLSAAEYVDPSRRPALETASALYQAENAKYVSFWMGSNTGDTVNNMQNAQWVKDAFDSLGIKNYVWFQGPGGHCACHSEKVIYSFLTDKVRVSSPANPVYRTNTLRYNKAYWIRIDRLQYANVWARLAADVTAPDRIEVEADNIAQFTLSTPSALVDAAKPLQVFVNGKLCYSGKALAFLSISAVTEQIGGQTYTVGQAWTAAPLVCGDIHKTPELSGPIGDAFRSKFLVVYGTKGGDRETAKNMADAQQFVDDWNAVMIQKNDDWGFPGPQVYLGAIADTAVTPEQIADSNLRLFGDQNTNYITAQIKDGLPLTLLNNGVRVGDREYFGDTVDYTLICPNPLNASKYVVAGRGYLAETAIPGSQKGKNLERLPWGEPDYVVWDTSRALGPTVQNPDGTVFKHLPDAYLEAGYFDQNWRLDTIPPETKASVNHTIVNNISKAIVTLSAADNLGGFGVERIEYSLDGGDWQTYQAPIEIATPGMHTFEYRAVDCAGRDVSPRNAVKPNIEQPKTLTVIVGQ